MKTITIPAKSTDLHNNPIVKVAGEDLSSAKAVVIMVHGRGATADGILDLANYFMFKGVSYIAPQAVGNIWYPYSFLVPLEINEPWISSALQRLSEIVDYVDAAGIPEQKIMLLGFSQGASLSLEWAARNSRQIAGVFALSGGIIGPPGLKREYSGSFTETSVFIGCSDVDFHIPKERVLESADVFRSMNANVTMRLYPNMAHTINDDEIEFVSSFLGTLLGR
ncbi:MAG: alpha/beta hydrolase [Bacteriovoracaceae bacterium]|nr:alpha/beta hydrolase [Bacteroidota bacterium]